MSSSLVIIRNSGAFAMALLSLAGWHDFADDSISRRGPLAARVRLPYLPSPVGLLARLCGATFLNH